MKPAIKGILIILGIVAIFVGNVVFTLYSNIYEHRQELEGLREETTQIFAGLDTARYPITSPSCSDVELRNECFITLSSSRSKEETTNYLKEYLQSQGFMETQGDELDDRLERASQKFKQKQISVTYVFGPSNLRVTVFYNFYK